MNALIAYKKNDQVLQVLGVKDSNGVAIHDAVVLARLLAPSGSEVAEVVNLLLSPIAGSAGDYQGTIVNSFDPAPGAGYLLMLDITKGPTAAHIELPVRVEIRVS